MRLLNLEKTLSLLFVKKRIFTKPVGDPWNVQVEITGRNVKFALETIKTDINWVHVVVKNIFAGTFPEMLLAAGIASISER